MSDSEDTDSLLSVTTPSGLKNFLGLTVEEMSLHINSLNSTQNERPDDKNNGKEERNLNQPVEEILSQLAEWSDSDVDLNDNDDAKFDSGSVSTASTDSITLLLPPESREDSKSKINTKETECKSNDATRTSLQVLPVASTENLETFPLSQNGAPSSKSSEILEFTYDKYKSPNYGVRVSPGFGAQGLDFLRPSPNSGWRYLPGAESDPQITARAPNFRTPGGYKASENSMPPRDLTDEQIQEEVKQMYAFPDSEYTNQMSSGVSSGPSNNIDTDSKVLSEESKSNKPAITPPESIIHCPNGEGDNQGLSQVEDQIIPNPSSSLKQGCKEEFEKETDGRGKFDSGTGVVGGKSVKRKLFSAGDTVGSVPDYGFGLRDTDKLEVREKPVVATHSWVSGHQQSHSQVQINRSDSGKPNVSFAQFRDDNNLEISPIKAAYLDKNGMSPDISRCLPRRHVNRNVIKSPRKVNLLELDLLWRDIQNTKSSMEADIRKSSECIKAISSSAFPSSSVSETLSSLETSLIPKEKKHQQLPSLAKVSFQDGYRSIEGLKTSSQGQSAETSSEAARKKHNKKKSILKSKNQIITVPERSPDLSKATDISFDFSGATDDASPSGMSTFDTSSVFPTDLDTIDLSSILSAAQLKASEFEDILGKLDDLTDVTWEEINGADDEIATVVTKLEVSDWAKSGANEYLQKYHEEKFKREHCEQEIANLQKTVLRLTEESVVREKMASKKDLVLLKMSKAWNEVTEQWKAHEVQSKSILGKLEKNQKVLTESLRQSKDRIEQYEKELANAVEVAASFKKKLENLEVSKCDIVGKLEGEHSNLKKQFSDLTLALDSIKVEKDAAVRALSESQKQLDERSAVHEEMQNKLSVLEVETTAGQKELQDAKEQTKALEAHLQSVTVKKDSLEGELVDLTEKLKIEQDEKERLESNLNLELERKVKDEAERLHNYYNVKLQEALQFQNQKMVMTETRMVEQHQQQLNELEKEMMTQLQECKNGFIRETSMMKSKYEKEIKKLRQDVSQKQLFISTISHQLQSYEQSEHTKGHLKPATIQGRSAVDGMSLNFCSNQKQILMSDVSVVSSSCNSTTRSSTPKYEVHTSQHNMVTDAQKLMPVEVPAAPDDGISVAEDFYPSKLSRYNTSTPNSIIVETPLVGRLKGWRELPNIQHLLDPFEEQNQHQLSQSRNDQGDGHGNEASMKSVRSDGKHGDKFIQSFLRENAMENPRKLDSIRDLPVTITEQGLQRCIQTLVKCYAERRSMNNSKVAGATSETVIATTTTTTTTAPAATDVSCHVTTIKSPDNDIQTCKSLRSPLISTCKMIKDNTNSCINSGRKGKHFQEQMIGLDQAGTGSGFKSVDFGVNVGGIDSTSFGFKQGKLMKPPWK